MSINKPRSSIGFLLQLLSLVNIKIENFEQCVLVKLCYLCSCIGRKLITKYARILTLYSIFFIREKHASV